MGGGTAASYYYHVNSGVAKKISIGAAVSNQEFYMKELN